MIKKDILLDLECNKLTHEKIEIFEGDGDVLLNFSIIGIKNIYSENAKYNYKILSPCGEIEISDKKEFKNARATVIIKREILEDIKNDNEVFKLQISFYDEEENRMTIPIIEFEVKRELKGVVIQNFIIAEDGTTILTEDGNSLFVNKLEMGGKNMKTNDYEVKSEGVKISELQEAEQINDDDFTILVQGNATKKVKSLNLRGLKGERGEVGPAGPQGPRGEIGERGPAGVQGPRGEVGPAGPKGEQGIAGERGPAGLQGETGPAGPRGETGPAGPRGEVGPAGPTGETGPRGERGPAGLQGPPGEIGPQGERGEVGPRGEAGPQGSQGPQGLGWLFGRNIPTNEGRDGELYLKYDNFDVYKKTGGTWQRIETIKGGKGEKGERGSEIALQKNATHIQWKVDDGVDTWHDLIALEDLKGEDGVVTGSHEHTNKTTLDKITEGKLTNWDSAFNHALTSHAPSNAQKNSDITKAEIEAKLTGNIESHIHTRYEPLINPKKSAFNKDFGTEAGQVAEGNHKHAEYAATGHTHEVIDNLTSASTTVPLSANQGKILKEKVDEVFQSVSNGKTLIASAITDKGVETSNTDTFEQMAIHISNIQGGGSGSLTPGEIEEAEYWKATTDWSYRFYGDKRTEIPFSNTSKVVNMNSLFYGCSNLTKIPLLDTTSVSDMTSMFYNCFNLTHIRFNPNAANMVSFDVSYCKNMTREDLIGMFESLPKISVLGRRLYLGDTLLNKLSDEDKLIATNKGYTLRS